ncbi:MAG TPA: alpha/beta hydrolase [Allosphingosinicella sp.]|nr:alpha/beta hydrolase [Allosphingosinicella sp.]
MVETPTLKLAYEETGPSDGLPVVLLHGFPYSPRAYDEVAASLVTEGFRVVVPFLRGFGPTRFLRKATLRSGEQAALGRDLLDLVEALALHRPLVCGFDWGGRAACVAAAEAPTRIRGLISCGGYNILAPAAAAPAAPAIEHLLWYQNYLQLPRGREMLSERREEFCRYLWRSWSPGWSFDEECFAQTACYFDNPDFVETVLHAYRHRFGMAPADASLADCAQRLEAQPDIAIPSMILWGDNGLIPGVSPRDRARFTGPFEFRRFESVGHNVPQEAPKLFAQAVRDLAALSR